MRLMSFLGSEYAYMILLPLVFWFIDEKRGVRLGIAVILSAWLNFTLKALFQQPRPFDLDPGVALAFEATYGLPSGHAQNALVLWVLIASWGREKWRYAAAALLILLISFSRLYLGVHFPTDIFAGWLLGIIILLIYFIPGPRIAALLDAGGLRARLITVSLAALLMNALHPGDITMGALLLGLGAGYGLAVKHLGYSPRGPGAGRPPFPLLALRFLLGFTVLALIYIGFRRFMPEKTAPSYRLFNFCRFGLLGAWVSLGAPWLFLKLRLVRE
jgi:membrane-associated phospholipid phosphatase